MPTFGRMGDFTHKPTDLANRPTPNTGAQIKQYLQQPSDDLKNYINNTFEPELEGTGADKIGITPIPNSTKNNLRDALVEHVSDNTVKLHVTDAEKSTWNAKQDAIGFVPATAQQGQDAEQALSVANSVRSDYNAQVINAGNSNAEIVDARGGDKTQPLRVRLDGFDSSLKDIEINVKQFGAVGNAKYRKYVESYWSDIGHTVPLYKKTTDGTFWTDSGFTNQYTGTVYAKPESVTYWQDAAFTIPATDDSAAFTAAINFITTMLARSATLSAPDGHYLLNNYNLVVDIAKFRLRGGNATKIISTGLATGSKFVTITSSSSDWAFSYDFMRDVISDVTFEGSYFQQNDVTNDGIMGIYFDIAVMLPHNFLHNVIAQWFNYGLYEAANSYKQGFDQCSFIANDINIYFDTASGTGGVPINFTNCYVECGTLALKLHNMGGCEVHFEGGSFEYNARVCDSWDYVTFHNVHCETDLTMASAAPFRIYGTNNRAHLSIKDSWILTLNHALTNVTHWIPTPIIYTNPCDYLFELNIDGITYQGNYLLDLDASITLNQNTNTKTLIGGSGSSYCNYKLHITTSPLNNFIVENQSINLYSNFDNTSYQSVATQRLSDFWITYDNALNTNRLTGTNIKIDFSASGEGVGGGTGRCLKITKIANSGSKANAGMFIPIVNNPNGYIIKLSYKLSNVPVNGNSKLYIGLFYTTSKPDPDTFNIDHIIPSVSLSNVQLANNTDWTDLYFYTNKPLKVNNNLLIEFQLSGVSETSDLSLLVDNIIINQI